MISLEMNDKDAPPASRSLAVTQVAVTASGNDIQLNW